MRPFWMLMTAPASVCFSAGRPAPRFFPARGLVQRLQQRLNLAEFRRPFVAGAVDGAQQQSDPDFAGQRGKRRQIVPGPASSAAR